MATRADITKRVRLKLEEYSTFEEVSYVLPDSVKVKAIDSYIEGSIDEALRELLLMLPIDMLSDDVRSYLSDDPLTPFNDEYGSYGIIPIFKYHILRLLSVKCESWKREANEGTGIYRNDEKRWREQTNRATRGRYDKPVALIRGNMIYLYSIDKGGDKVEYAEYIGDNIEVERVESRLIIDLLVLLIASKIKGIYGDYNGAKYFEKELYKKIVKRRI